MITGDCRSDQSTVRKQPRASFGRRSAVTMIELLVAVTLISFIILALYQMFDKTQEQLRRAMAQVDTLENGRAIVDMLQRDLGKVTVPPFESTNFTFYRQESLRNVGTNGITVGFLNADGSTTNVFTNSLDRCLFLINDQSLRPTNWGAIGYHVGHPDDPTLQPTNGIGSLYRFAFHTNNNQMTPSFIGVLTSAFLERGSTEVMSRVADNIVHFRVRTYPTDIMSTNLISVTRWEPPYVSVLQQIAYSTNVNLPSLVEVELGYVDEETAGIVTSFGDQYAASNYLAQVPQKMNLFRFLVPVKTLR